MTSHTSNKSSPTPLPASKSDSSAMTSTLELGGPRSLPESAIDEGFLKRERVFLPRKRIEKRKTQTPLASNRSKVPKVGQDTTNSLEIDQRSTENPKNIKQHNKTHSPNVHNALNLLTSTNKRAQETLEDDFRAKKRNLRNSPTPEIIIPVPKIDLSNETNTQATHEAPPITTHDDTNPQTT